MPNLTVQNAEIKTATVEIKALTVSGKQVTQSVFKQLKEFDAISEAGEFHGTPWGTVNYHPDKCADSGAHLHVVWQLGAELRRSLVRKPNFYKDPFWDDIVDHFAESRYCANEHSRPDWMRMGRDVEGDRIWVFTYGDVHCGTSDLPSSRHDSDKCTAFDDDDMAFFVETIAKEKARQIRHHERWRELADLPHLFIAV